MQFNQPVTELVRQRFSCRSYSQQPIAQDVRLTLGQEVASGDAGPFGSQPRLQLVTATEEDRKALRGLTTYGFIRGATGFLIGAVTPTSHNLEDFGYLVERIILHATDLNLGSCWLGGTFNKSRFAKKIELSDDESVPAVVSLGYIAAKPRRLDAMIRRGAGSDARLPWERLFFDAEFGVPLSPEEAGEYAVPLEMVRLGPSASNQQPWRIIRHDGTWHLYLQRTPGYGEGGLSRFTRTTADMQRIDMGIAMSHFDLSADELGLDGKWKILEPAIPMPDSLIEYVASWESA
jgi:nitroreductase